MPLPKDLWGTPQKFDVQIAWEIYCNLPVSDRTYVNVAKKLKELHGIEVAPNTILKRFSRMQALDLAKKAVDPRDPPIH